MRDDSSISTSLEWQDDKFKLSMYASLSVKREKSSCSSTSSGDLSACSRAMYSHLQYYYYSYTIIIAKFLLLLFYWKCIPSLMSQKSSCKSGSGSSSSCPTLSWTSSSKKLAKKSTRAEPSLLSRKSHPSCLRWFSAEATRRLIFAGRRKLCSVNKKEEQLVGFGGWYAPFNVP